MSFTSQLKRRGIAGTIIYAIQKTLGITNLQEETSALFYFFDQHFQPKDLPRTSNIDLRNLQDCDTLLLAIFDKMCKKYELNYWIEYGTLLGAVRHNGFIPWDDDTDVAMPREDFNKVYDLMRGEFEKHGITLEYSTNELSSLCLHYKHMETGIWLDITPMDSFTSPYDLDDTRRFLYPKITKYIKYYNLHKNSPTYKIWEKKNRMIFGFQSGERLYLFHGQEFRQSKIRVFRKEDLLPCKRIFFNGIELSAPSNPDEYLSYVYSKNYMNFPHGGISHHGEATGRPPLDQWAKQNNIDMNEVKEFLKNVLLMI
jgi:lipopolysaccharide cholinephosphotransferase